MPLLLLLYMSEIKLRFMKRAIELGEQVRNKTGDNPWVGCVIVRGEKVWEKVIHILQEKHMLKQMQFLMLKNRATLSPDQRFTVPWNRVLSTAELHPVQRPLLKNKFHML
ncbi:MAG: hypothetical protein Ct9H300mP21_08000 [Pseudomonadota bacterium]|nr:MAG: hypothetical protein Ct9H300mP21_08000 [Pseudomonadota bacterium]